MQQANTPIELVFKYTRNRVIEETNHKQIPWEESSLSGENFSFIEQKEIDILPLVSSINEAFKVGLKSLSLPNLISLLETNNLESGQIQDHQFYLTLAKICMDFENKSIQQRTLDPDYLSDRTFNKYYPDFIEHLSYAPENEDEVLVEIFQEIEILNEINFGYNSIDEEIENSFPQFFINEIKYKGKKAILSCFLYVSKDETEFILNPLIFYQEKPVEYLSFKKIKGEKSLSFLKKYFELRKPFEKEPNPLSFHNFIEIYGEDNPNNESKKGFKEIEDEMPTKIEHRKKKKKNKIIKRKRYQRKRSKRKLKKRK